ncbi:hypothetical protein A2U01_0074142, partial [Trifolium medium]|nr:hypothetical protein [Trifolium medium]
MEKNFPVTPSTANVNHENEAMS